MKKHELLKYAYDNYPKGISFKQISSGKRIISSGIFKLNIYQTWFSVSDQERGDFVYNSTSNKWAEIVSDKKPLLITEDGVEVFEDIYKYINVVNIESNVLVERIECTASNLDTLINKWGSHYKVFSTKQAALEWIEAQKPKEKNVKINDDVVATVYKEGWAKFSVPVFRLSENQIKSLLEAMAEIK